MNDKFTFHTIFSTVKRLVLLNGIFLLLMSVFRLIFFLYFERFGHFQGMYRYLLKAFFMGMRFDLVVVAYINTLVTLTLLFVWMIGSRKVYDLWRTAVKFYYFLFYSAVFSILCVDFGFYTYFKNHINILIFGIFEDDTKALFSTLAQNYNLFVVGLGFLALFALVYLMCGFFLRREEGERFFARPYPPVFRAGFAVMLICGNAIAARGSFNMFPLGTMDAEISSDVFINKLCLNGLFTLQEAVEYRMKENRDYNLMKMVGYDGNAVGAFADFLGVSEQSLPKENLCRALIRKTRKNPAAAAARPNVVVIMMEGFGIDLSSYNSDSFNVLGGLQRHFGEDYLFSNFLSGDVGTIGSIESVLMNMPKRPLAKALSQSKYAYGMHPSGAAWPYRRAGYDTIFLYGGNAGWRNVFNFVPTLGFTTSEGEGSMDPKYLRNQWGVYDEYLFDYLYGKLSAKDGKPKFIFAMSTSNHPPYSLPPSYSLLPLNVSPDVALLITGDKALALERFKTYQYACQKLGELITRIKASPLGDNTIIAVTGDHNFWSVFDYPAARYLDLDGVPFYLYVPRKLKPAAVDTAAFGSHIDIMPTLYNLSLSDQEYVSVGVDMLDPRLPHIAYNVDGIILSKECGLRHFADTNTTAWYSWDPGALRRLAASGASAEHQRLLKHYKAALAVTDFLSKNPFPVDMDQNK